MSTKSATSREQMLANEPIPKLLAKLAIPAVMAQFINLLYNIVDRVYIGNIPETGALALTGLGLAFPIIMLISAFAAFAGAGGAPLAAIQLGAGNRDEAQRILGTSFAMLMVFSVILTVVFSIWKEPILYAFGASADTIGYACDYIGIYLIGTFFVQTALGLNTFISTQGRSGIAMLSVMLGAALNLILDPIFIFGFSMGVRGAAVATVISQGASAVWVLCFLCSKRSGLRLQAKNIRLKPKLVGKISSLGISPFIMQSTESLVSITINTGLQQFGGDLYVGGQTIIVSVMQMVFLPVQGVVQGAQPIISFNYGARNFKRVREAFRLLLIVCVFITTSACLATMLFPQVLARIFTPDTELIAIVSKTMPIYFAGLWAFGVQMACQNTFVGLGQAKVSLFLALLRKVVLLIPLAILLPRITGSVFGIYAAEPISDILASATTLALFLWKYPKLLPVDKEKA